MSIQMTESKKWGDLSKCPHVPKILNLPTITYCLTMYAPIRVKETFQWDRGAYW